MQWGPETDAKLFMHVMAISKVKLDYQALAVAMGDDCTHKAIMHRMAKLRAQAAKPSTTASSTSTDPAGPNAGKGGTPKSPRTPSTPGVNDLMNAATTSPTPTTGKTNTAATTTTPTTGANNSAPTKNTKSGAASTGTKRTAAGKAKTTKGSPLKVKLVVENEDDAEEELQTPSKRPRNSGLGFGNTDLDANSTLRQDEIAGQIGA